MRGHHLFSTQKLGWSIFFSWKGQKGKLVIANDNIGHIHLRLVQDQHVQFFLIIFHLGHHKTVTHLSYPKFSKFIFWISQSTPFSLWIGYWDVFLKINYSYGEKKCAQFVSLIFGCFPEKSIFQFFINQKSSKTFSEYLCRPTSGICEIKILSPMCIK